MHGCGSESPTDHSGGLEGGLLGRREQVDALREQRLDGIRNDEVARDLVRHAPVSQHPQDLLDEERIAVRAFDNKSARAFRQRLRGKTVDDARCILGRQRHQHDRLGG